MPTVGEARPGVSRLAWEPLPMPPWSSPNRPGVLKIRPQYAESSAYGADMAVNMEETKVSASPEASGAGAGPMFERVLVAIDDSQSSPVALSYVAALAGEHGSSVHVLSVNEILIGGRGLAAMTDSESARLVEVAVRELRGGGIDASGSVVRANGFYLAQAIVEAAEDRQADAIVVGSRRRRRLGRVFGRSVRDRVISLTALPVLVAPAPLEATGRHLRGNAVFEVPEVDSQGAILGSGPADRAFLYGSHGHRL